ncbi:MAG: preprotein translocase subunit SecG [Clostridiales bacterium]|jgi:preprotein translocase subunit SecG|nr:preprotein translocase subunit SecG [Clostridiales bacterium]
MSIWFIILSIIAFICCVAINIMILMQKKRSAGLSAGVVGMGQGDTFWDKNKSRSLEGKLERYTKICGAVFMAAALVLNII